MLKHLYQKPAVAGKDGGKKGGKNGKGGKQGVRMVVRTITGLGIDYLFGLWSRIG